MEDGVVTVSDRGTGQGSVISPLLANIYLHYTLDLWAMRWRQREATGDEPRSVHCDRASNPIPEVPDGTLRCWLVLPDRPQPCS
jgi:retron-type reverse transcriptase